MILKRWALYLLALVCLLLRDPHNFLTHYLWSEDGKVFLAQSHSGLLSLLWPYQGYLHVYCRTGALLATVVPAASIPLAFALVWLTAFLLSVAVVIHCAVRLGMRQRLIAPLLMLIALQPGTPEVFFTLTNSQWWLGIALVLYLCTPWGRAPTRAGLVLLGAWGLSGPFSLIMLPVLALRAALLRDYPAQGGRYAVLITSALLQAVFLLTTSRDIGADHLDTVAADWWHALWIFLSFGGLLAGPGLWLIASAAVVGRLREPDPDRDATLRRHVTLLLVASMAVMTAAAFYASRDNVAWLNPLGLRARYMVVPYSLLFFLLCYLIRGWRLGVVLGLALLLCLAGLGRQPADRARQNLQWPAYTRLAERVPGIIIPIDPLYGYYQGWHVLGDYVVAADSRRGEEIRLQVGDFQAVNASLQRMPPKLTVTPRLSAPQLELNLGSRCAPDSYVGLTIHVVRLHAGYARLYWSADGRFSDVDRLQGYYPEGQVEMQFAFHRRPGENILRFDPEGSDPQPTVVTLDSVRLYCLGD